MSYRLQLSPRFDTRPIEAGLRSSEADYEGLTNWDGKFFRFWLVYDSELQSYGHINWNLLQGLAIAVAVSAAFWTAAGFAIARLLR